jgi:hypothetical protein
VNRGILLRAAVETQDKFRGQRRDIGARDFLGFGPKFPPQLRAKIDLVRRNIETDRAQEVRNSFAAAHRFVEAAGEDFEVFFVGFEIKFPVGEVRGERFIVVIDQIDESAPELRAHLRVDHDPKRARARVRGGGRFF